MYKIGFKFKNIQLTIGKIPKKKTKIIEEAKLAELFSHKSLRIKMFCHIYLLGQSLLKAIGLIIPKFLWVCKCTGFHMEQLVEDTE